MHSARSAEPWVCELSPKLDPEPGRSFPILSPLLISAKRSGLGSASPLGEALTYTAPHPQTTALESRASPLQDTTLEGRDAHALAPAAKLPRPPGTPLHLGL